MTAPAPQATGPYTVTVGGGGVGFALVNVTTLKTSALANQVLTKIANLPSGSATLLGGGNPGSYGAISTTVPASYSAIVINNSDPTTVSNTADAIGQVVYAGLGNVMFTDLGTSDTIVAGGGNDVFNFGTSSNGATLLADGANTINISAATGTTTIYGTSSSADTIYGSASAGGGIYYVSSAGSTAFINPGADNATVIGTAGGIEHVSSVYGGTPFTGTLYLVDGTGYFVGGSNGGNVMGSSTVGSTTLIGGGQHDVLTSNGYGDVLRAGAGAETLQGGSSAGDVSFYASNSGADVFFANSVAGGGLDSGDTFYASSSTVIGSLSVSGPYAGYKFKGSFVVLHPNANNQSTNTQGSTIVGNALAAPQFVTVGDFILGTDKLSLTVSAGTTPVIVDNQTTVIGGNSITYSTVTANGSTFTFLGKNVTTHDVQVNYASPV